MRSGPLSTLSRPAPPRPSPLCSKLGMHRWGGLALDAFRKANGDKVSVSGWLEGGGWCQLQRVGGDSGVYKKNEYTFLTQGHDGPLLMDPSSALGHDQFVALIAPTPLSQPSKIHTGVPRRGRDGPLLHPGPRPVRGSDHQD